MTTSPSEALRAAEQRVERLSQLYRTLSDMNEAMAQAETEAALCQKVCDVIARLGGTRIARILFHEPERNVLAQVAFAGMVPPSADVVVMSLALGSRHHGMLPCEVFRSGEPCVYNDTRTDGAPAWCEGIRRAGIASIVCLPLRRDGEVIGVLSISSEETGYFDAELVRLLEGVTRNVSVGLERLRWARELGASEERYRSLVETMDHVVYTLDAQGRFTYVSAAVANFGYAPQDLVGKTFWHLLHEKDRADIVATWNNVQTGMQSSNDVRVRDGAGKVRQVRATARPMIEEGRFVGMRGVVTDLTQQRDAEEQLRQAQKLEAIGRLAGGVAHDFNNLLTVIGSYTDLVMESVREEDPLFADLGEIRKATSRATALTRQLLAFSRKQVLQPHVLDLNVLVGKLENMLRRLLGEDIQLTFLPSGSSCMTRADAGQIEQVLLNLALNARDAMPHGGELTIRTQDVNIGESSVDGHEAPHTRPYVMVSISDTGTGMDDATLARIFEPFFTTKPSGKGTGLGLAMVYGIVKQSGGVVQVTSEVGQGSTFNVLLPREAARPGEERPAPPTPRRAPVAGKILVVEDEEAVRKLAARLLAAEGYDVLTAANAGEALLASEKHGPEIRLLLTDVVMPAMNGHQLADRLSPLCPRMRVLFMSGYADDVIMERGVVAPGTHLINKPFTGETLLPKVHSMLAGSE